MSNTLNFGQKVVFLGGNAITLPVIASDPGSAVAGDMYFNSTSNVVRVYSGSTWSNVASAGTVTSVTFTGDGTVLSSTPSSAVTSSGTLTAALKTQAQNSVLAGPTSGTGAPTFRSLVAADIPSLSSTYLPLGGGTMSGAIAMGSNAITGVTNPSNPQDAATKNYVDNAVAGLAWKAPVAAASVGSNINLSAPGATLDGYSFVSGDRFLAKDQTTASQNGIYIFNGAAAAATRSTDMNTWSEVVNAVMLVTNGSTNQGAKFVNTNVSGGTIGTTAITFVAFSVAGSVNGTGTANYVAYWNGTSTLTSEQYLAAARGGLGVNASAFTGVVKSSAGSFSASSIVDADVSSSAAIQYSKLASLSTGQILLGNAGVPTATTLSGDASVGATGTLTLATVNASPNTYALSTVTVNAKGLVTSASAASTTGSGNVVLATSPTLTTPNIGAATGSSLQLSGLTASQAIFTDASKNLVSNAITGSGNVVMSASPTLTGTITAAAANLSGALGANGGITSSGALLINSNAGAAAVQLESSTFQRSTDGTNFVTQKYVDATTLTDNSGPTAIAAFQFAVASFAGIEITYVIESGNAAADRRIGTIRATANSSGTITPSLSDMYSESADCGVSWSATNSSGTISINYTATNQGANRTMRADVKYFRA